MSWLFTIRGAGAATLLALLAACGGGGGGADEAAPPPEPSQAQALFDEATLASNGGSQQIVAAHVLDGSGRQPPRVSWATIWTLSMDRSPFGRTDGATATPAAPAPLIVVEGTPSTSFANDVGGAVLWDGAIHFIRNNAASRVRHDGDDVIIETRSTDGAYTRAERITAITKHALRGRITAAPAEFRQLYSALLALLDRTAEFPAGAAYYKRTSVRMGSLLSIQDADFNAATDPQSATPLTTGTIEDMARRFGIDLRNGRTRQVHGARCWVRSNPDELISGIPTTYSADPAFATACEVDGKVYLGSLQPDGAVLGSSQPTATDMERVPFTIRLNKAAADGLRAMVP